VRSIFSISGKWPVGRLARHTEKLHEPVCITRPLTELEPVESERGFSAQFRTATAVLVSARLGLPISTPALVGAVMGVALEQAIAALDLRIAGNAVNLWLAILPAVAGLSAGVFVLLRTIFL
jgi:PiT family inorganic phosphate transporter